MRLRSALFGLILATASASCSFLLDYDELQKGSSGKTISIGDMPAALAGALCRRIDRCTGPARVVVLGDEDCDILFGSVLRDSLFSGMPALPKGSFEYHAELAQSCIDAMEKE